MAKKLKKVLAVTLSMLMIMSTMNVSVFAMNLGAEPQSGGNWNWNEQTKTLTLDGASVEEGFTKLPDGSTVIVKGNVSIAAGSDNGLSSAGKLTVKGEGDDASLKIVGSNGINAGSVSVSDLNVDFEGTSCGVQVYNDADDAEASLNNVDGRISGGYAGIYVSGEKADSSASVNIEGCELDVTSTATSWNNRARKSGITVYVSTAEKVESSINIKDSVVNAVGYDAGLSINNYLGDADATNSASSKINIINSTVVANGTSGTWSGIFASVLGQHPDADAVITIKDSSVYAVSPNTGILTSSQAGESKIILDNSVLGASGKTALSMIEETSQKQAAELKNGSTYIQMTPEAVMKGQIDNFDGKVIEATAGDGISFDAENHYYVIPQGSAVTESYTDGTENEYTFNNQAGGVGGFEYAKEEIWGFDEKFKWDDGDIIIYTPEELIEFAEYTQDGTLGNCEGRTVKLGADIDMTGYDWYYRNAGGTVVTDHRIPEFSGIFDGQGYSIKNMSYRDEYKEATDPVPLAFILTANGTHKDFTIDGIAVDTVAPARFGGMADALAYSGDGYTEDVIVKNIVVNADAQLAFGGFAFKILDIAYVKDCQVDGFTVNAAGVLNGPNSGRCGGFFATGGESTPFTDCSVSDFVVNAESTGTYLGGFVGGASMTASYTNCDVNGFKLNAAAKLQAVGGFAAYTAGSAWGEGLSFENCDVTGLDIETTNVISVGVGGFIGNLYGQGKSLENGAHHFINCTTEGTISGDTYAGGFAGWLYGRSNGCAAAFEGCHAAVNIIENDYFGGGFIGNFTPASGCQMITSFSDCTASGDVFAAEPEGLFIDSDNENTDGIIGGTYSYDPEDEPNANVAPGYRALDNGDGTWTVFPDNGKEVVKVAFHRWNDDLNGYENWRTVEVFKDVDFFEADYDNELNFSHKEYRFTKGIRELDEEAGKATKRPFTYWTDAPDGTELVLDNEIEVVKDMDVYAAYADYVCEIVETGVKYTTLTAAVADANASEDADTIRMLKSIDYDSEKALTINGDVTIIGEGMTISRGAYKGTLFTVPAGSSLTLDGGIVFDGDNKWIFEKELYENDLYNRVDNPISSYAYSAEGGTVATAAMFVVNGAVTMKDATIQNCFNTKDSNAGDGAIFKVNANATLTMEASALVDHVATYGANAVAHLAKDAKWYIKDNTMISNNFGGRNGGICRNDSGQIYMSGGTIKDTAGKNVNGTVFMMYGTGSAFYMTGGTICGNSSTFGANNGRCAAVYLHENAYMQMTGGTICHNIGGTRGGIDSYKRSSVLDINRVDQDFDNEEWKESGAAAYTASNHPYIVDNVSLIDNTSHDVGHSNNFDTWWVTGGIYTQDVDEFCAEGYVCIPYDDSERTDDYIVVPGYRVNYFSVEKVENEDGTIDYNTTLEKKYFHLLPRDKFWYEMDERANYFELTNEEGGTISTWYSEKELVNIYDFANTKLESDINVYGEWKYTDEAAVVLTVDMSGTMYRYKMGGKRYVDVAKAKALDFVEQYAAKVNKEGDVRMLAIASFDTDAKVVLNWVDVNTAEGLAAAKKAINGMKVADNGKTSSNQVCTNFDGGIILTRNLLKQSVVDEIDNKFAIVLSDGAPTVTVNKDTDTVGTIKSSFWGNQLDMNGKKYQNKHCGGGWTHPGEVDRTLKYLATGANNLADQTTSYGDNKEGIFFVGVGGDMSVKLFNDAVYGTSNGTRTSDVKKKPAAFNHVEALEGISQSNIMKMTTGGWLDNLAEKVGGTYVPATNASALQNEFDSILDAIVNS